MAAVLVFGSQAWAKEHEGHHNGSPLTFKGAVSKYDTNKDKKLSQEELAGSGEDFEALDANKDGSVDAKEWRSAKRHGHQSHRSGAKTAPEKPTSTNPM